MEPTAEELIGMLRRNPDDAAAYAALRGLYQRNGDYPSLVNLIEGFGQRTRDPQMGAASYFDAAELAWGALGDPARGSALYERALERYPLHNDAFARLLAIYEEAGDSHRLSALYERRAEALAASGADPRSVAEVQQRLGELWQHMFHRTDRAIVHYRKAFELDATLVPAIYAARDIYQQAGNTKAAAALLEMESKAETDEERRIALLRELAHLRGDELGDQEGAIVALKRALGFSPANPELLNDLATLYLSRASRQPDAQVADSDRRRAADVFFQLAQKAPPTEAVPLLGRALDVAPDHEAALALLERIAERVGHFELLPGRWVAFLSRAPEAPLAGERRRRLARAYLDAGQVEYAITCLEWMAAEGDLEATEQLIDLYTRAGRADEALRIVVRAGPALPVTVRALHLRRALEVATARGDDDASLAHAREILALDPADPEATAYLESFHRRRGEWRELRDLLLAAARVPGAAVDARKQRLREVAQISERRLSDADGAIQAWRQVATLDASDREARSALARLLEAAQRWDDLAEVVERDAMSAPDEETKAEAYRRLALLHGTQRNDPREAALAWRSLLDAKPGDVQARDMWIESLLASEAWLEALSPLRERVRGAAPGPQRAEAHRTLGRTLEHVADTANTRDARWHEATEAWTRVLDDAPQDREALERLERMAELQQDWERLLRALAYRSDIETGAAKVAVLLRMGQTAERSIGDSARAAEIYHRAFELDPKSEEVLDALTSVYERTERYRDLVSLLRDRAHVEEAPQARASLYRRIARVLHERVQNDSGAVEAYRRVLEAGEDDESLRFLYRYAMEKRAFDEAEALLLRVAALPQNQAERRDLLAERVDVLVDRLGKTREGADAMHAIVRDVDTQHLPSLGRLGDLAESLGDHELLAEALERTLAVVDDPALRAPIGARLLRLCTNELTDTSRAIQAGFVWHEADAENPEPLREMIPLLEHASRHDELVRVLDALSLLETDTAESNALMRRAATVLAEQMGDADGAMQRLEGATRSGDEEALARLWALAREARKGDRLVQFFSDEAQAADEGAAQKREWSNASKAADTLLGDAARAFELTLKALAADLSDVTVLDDADRLAAASKQYPRLGQVYDTLLRKTDDKGRKVELLLRQAEILRQDPSEQGNALDRFIRAASLAPFDARVITAIEELAPRIGRAEDLLSIYDRRKKDAPSDAARVDELVASARVAEVHLKDRERSVTYLALGVALAVRSPALFELIETRAMETSKELCRALVDVYAALAEDMEADPRGAASLLVRAANLLRLPPRDEASAYGALLRAVSIAPYEAGPLDALESLAAEQHKLEAFATQLEKLISEVVDSKTATVLGRRRALVLERMNRFDQAAECWVRLRQLSPNDVEVRTRLRAALGRAKKYEELLLALENDLRILKDPTLQLALRREVAMTWDQFLHNRWEALEAWERVRKLAPEDAEAIAAVARLKPGGAGVLTAPLANAASATSLTDEDASLLSVPDEEAERIATAEVQTPESALPSGLEPFDFTGFEPPSREPAEESAADLASLEEALDDDADSLDDAALDDASLHSIEEEAADSGLPSLADMTGSDLSSADLTGANLAAQFTENPSAYRPQSEEDFGALEPAGDSSVELADSQLDLLIDAHANAPAEIVESFEHLPSEEALDEDDLSEEALSDEALSGEALDEGDLDEELDEELDAAELDSDVSGEVLESLDEEPLSPPRSVPPRPPATSVPPPPPTKTGALPPPPPRRR
jgi:tetratricopeptide (TPR) repeat protein